MEVDEYDYHKKNDCVRNTCLGVIMSFWFFVCDRGIQASCITINTITTSIPTKRLGKGEGLDGVFGAWIVNWS